MSAIVKRSLTDVQNYEILNVNSGSHRPNEEPFLVEARLPTLIIRSEKWAPGWKKYVDNEEHEVLPVDCGF